MSAGDAASVVLVVEDGGEYFETLSRFGPGPRWLRTRSWREEILRAIG